MGSAKVTTKEIDLSARVPSFPGVYGGIVIPAAKGPIDKNVLCTSETDLLNAFTPNGKVEVGFSTAYFSALNFLQKSNKLWVRRAVHADAMFGGAVINTGTSPYGNFSLPSGMVDPTAYVFDSQADVPAVAQITRLVFSQVGSFYDNNGPGFAIQLFNSPAVGHYFWFSVTGGANVQTDPGLVGTGHQVAVLPGDTAAQVATKFFNAVVTVSAAFTAINSVSAQVDVTNVTAGALTSADSVTGSAAALSILTAGAAAITIVDDALLIFQSNPGLWGTKVYIKVTNYATNQKLVGTPGAFAIQVFLSGNLVVPVETFICSRTHGAVDGFGTNIFVEDQLQGSLYIRAISNPAIDDSVSPKDQLTALQLTGGLDGSAVTDADMVSALGNFANKDQMLLTVVMDGGWTTPVFQQAIDSLVQARGDSVGVFGVPISAEASSTYITDIESYKNTTLNLASSWSAIYTPHVLAFDKYNNRQVYVGPDGYAAAAISFSASNFAIWFPPAGFKRGAITAIDVRRRFSEGERDSLYDSNINPLRFVPGKGIFIWGQKTLNAVPSALDRLNVRLMLITVEPAVAAALENFEFELSDATTQTLAATLVTNYMNTNIKGKRGVTDFKVICDSTNNSADDVDNGIMNLWLFVKPTRSAEFINFSVIITPTGISFSLASQLAA